MILLAVTVFGRQALPLILVRTLPVSDVERVEDPVKHGDQEHADDGGKQNDANKRVHVGKKFAPGSLWLVNRAVSGHDQRSVARFGLRPSVERTGAENASTRIHFGVSVLRAGHFGLRGMSMEPLRAVRVSSEHLLQWGAGASGLPILAPWYAALRASR